MPKSQGPKVTHEKSETDVFELSLEDHEIEQAIEQMLRSKAANHLGYYPESGECSVSLMNGQVIRAHAKLVITSPLAVKKNP